MSTPANNNKVSPLMSPSTVMMNSMVGMEEGDLLGRLKVLDSRAPPSILPTNEERRPSFPGSTTGISSPSRGMQPSDELPSPRREAPSSPAQAQPTGRGKEVFFGHIRFPSSRGILW